MGKLHLRKIPFSDFRYKMGRDFTSYRYIHLIVISEDTKDISEDKLACEQAHI